MKKKLSFAMLVMLAAGSLTLPGHASKIADEEEMAKPQEVVTEDMTAIYAEDLKEGTYSIEVLSSSSMFTIIDCQLTVKNGEMTAVMTLKGDGYSKLFMGTGAEAVEASEEEYITYTQNEDGRQMYEVPVEALDAGIACTSWSVRKEKWYDRTLVFSAAALPMEAYQEGQILTLDKLNLPDGTYSVEVRLSGGSGKTTVDSPVTMKIEENKATAVITFSSSNYSYVMIDEVKYEPVNEEGNSTFEIPVTGFDWNMPLKANSVAMGMQHEIDYTLYFDSKSIQTNSLPDGEYTPDAFSWSGGSGKVEITCEKVTVKDGKAYAEVTFSSSSYGYVKVNGETFQGINTEETSVFEIPVVLNANNTILGMTTKMSSAHEIAYEIYVSLKEDAEPSAERADVPEILGLTFEAERELSYAEYLRIYDYHDGISLLEVDTQTDKGIIRYLVVPENVQVPAGLDKDLTIIKAPAENIYYAETVEIPDFKEILLSDCELAVYPAELLGADAESYETITSGYETLGIPLFIDCSSTEQSEEAKAEWESALNLLSGSEGTSEVPEVSGLIPKGQLKLDFAECYDVYFYEEDYALIEIYESGRFLLVPEGGEIPEGLDAEITVLQQPLDKIYLQATSAMSLFNALDSLGNIRMTGTQAENWYIEETVKAMESGEMLFAGKYREPDYEMLIDEGCDLALESTMLLHTPKVQEMIEMLGIPVMIERASYETHPLARTEWIKLYGVLMDKEQEAEAFFEEQKQVLEEMADFENTEKTIAFFYMNTDGTLVVRRKSDYIPRMIEIAGGRYVYGDNWKEDEGGSNVYLTMEEFYAAAGDADYLVYNAAIANELGSVEELLALSELFADFKAVKEGNVWTTNKGLFQSTDTFGQLISDFHYILTGENTEQMTFLKKVE